MSRHEAFLKAMRVEPNDSFHERIYTDFLLEQGYDPPGPYLVVARFLAPYLHSARQALRPGRHLAIGRFGVEVIVSCTRLNALQEICLPGRILQWDERSRPVRVEPNIGEDGLVLLVGSPLMEQIRSLNVRYNGLGPAAVAALLRSPYLGALEQLVIAEPPDILPTAL